MPRLKSELDMKKNPHGKSFDTVCVLKRTTDQKDPYLIYILNNFAMNNYQLTYIYNYSRDIDLLAIEMDMKEGKYKHSHAHVDAKHDCTKGMKTIT